MTIIQIFTAVIQFFTICLLIYMGFMMADIYFGFKKMFIDLKEFNKSMRKEEKTNEN